MKCPYCGVDAIHDNRTCTNCGYDVVLKTRDPRQESLNRVREYGFFGPMITDMLEARAQLEQEKLSKTSNYDRNIEADTRQKTADLYKWEGQALKESEDTGKQYQIPLRKTLHMDIPGMESFMAAGASLALMPIIVTAPAMMAQKKLEAQRSHKPK